MTFIFSENINDFYSKLKKDFIRKAKTIKKNMINNKISEQLSIQSPKKVQFQDFTFKKVVSTDLAIINEKKSTEKNNSPETKIQKLGRKERFKALLLDRNFEQENPKKFEELTDKTCKWPIGHPYEKNLYFCGRKPMEKFPYCKLHVLYAFQPKNAKEEDQITEEDIPKFIEKKIKSA